MGRRATLNRRAKMRAAKEMDLKEGEKRLHGLLGRERARVRSNLYDALAVLDNMSSTVI